MDEALFRKLLDRPHVPVPGDSSFVSSLTERNRAIEVAVVHHHRLAFYYWLRWTTCDWSHSPPTDRLAPDLVTVDWRDDVGCEGMRCGAMAQLRTVGKGVPLVVTDGGEWVADDRSDDLDFLVSHFDQREGGFSTSATGMGFCADLDTKGVILPRWNTESSASTRYGRCSSTFSRRPS